MLLPTFRRPSVSSIREFLVRQARLPLTYAMAGTLADEPPPGYRANPASGSGWAGGRRPSTRRGRRCGAGSSSPGGGWSCASPTCPSSPAGSSPCWPAAWGVVAQRLPDRLRRGRGWARRLLRVRLRHPPRARRGGRGAVPGRVGPGRRLGLVRPVVLLPAQRLARPPGRRISPRGPRRDSPASPSRRCAAPSSGDSADRDRPREDEGPARTSLRRTGAYTPEGYVSGIFSRSGRRCSGCRARVSSM